MMEKIKFLTDIIVNGDLTVQGTSYSESAEQILTKGALTVINADNNDLDLTLMGTVIRTGKKDDNDNYIDYAIIYDPLNEAVRLGVGIYNTEENTFAFNEGEGQPVATRDLGEDDDGYLVMWDAKNYCLVKSSIRYIDGVIEMPDLVVENEINTNTLHVDNAYVYSLQVNGSRVATEDALAQAKIESINQDAVVLAEAQAYTNQAVENISMVLVAGEGENSIVLPEFVNSDGSVVENNAYGKANIALGYGVSAGALSWRITYYNIDTPQYVIVYDPNDKITEDVVDKEFGVRLSNNYDKWGKITAIARDTVDTTLVKVYFDTPIEEANYDATVGIDDLTSDKNTLKIYDMASEGEISTGAYAFAEGYATEAQGMISHAEGYNTRAIGKYAHAEGHTTIAGYSAHSEGNRTKAIGWNSHAEGASTQAIGNASHTEGESTIASGQASHAEGNNTQATEYCSHASGAGTRATERCQFVQGRFNVVDANGSSGDYAHIVGGGTADNDRKNIYTLDWQGNAVFAGNVTGKDGKSLSTNDFTTPLKDKVVNLPIAVASGNYAISRIGDEPGQATGVGAIAIGPNTQATKRGASAFGIGTKATQEGAFAEGHMSQATGWVSHAEGNGTQATHTAAHTEGSSTKARSEASHAEGIGTLADGAAVHTQGKYNIKNTVDDTYPAGKYAHIVGNGKSDSQRSNAHTLDWDGNAWFAKDVRIGGTSYDDAEEIATKNHVSTMITPKHMILKSSTSGSNKKFQITINDSGALSAKELFNLRGKWKFNETLVVPELDNTNKVVGRSYNVSFTMYYSLNGEQQYDALTWSSEVIGNNNKLKKLYYGSSCAYDDDHYYKGNVHAPWEIIYYTTDDIRTITINQDYECTNDDSLYKFLKANAVRVD